MDLRASRPPLAKAQGVNCSDFCKMEKWMVNSLLIMGLRIEHLAFSKFEHFGRCLSTLAIPGQLHQGGEAVAEVTFLN